jgi:hypothetical protein
MLGGLIPRRLRRPLDYRVYLPRLLADFAERGGDFRAGQPGTSRCCCSRTCRAAIPRCSPTPSTTRTRRRSSGWCWKSSAHHPRVFERVDAARFGLTRPEDLLQGAVTPVLREDYAILPNGRVAIALGDAHSVVDPVVGQGANSASCSAWELGAVIAEDPDFDERFAQKVAARRANRVRAISDWTNLMIGLPPAPHLLQLLGAMSQNPAVADVFTDNFNQPERQWDTLATPERTRAFPARHGM